VALSLYSVQLACRCMVKAILEAAPHVKVCTRAHAHMCVSVCSWFCVCVCVCVCV